MNRIAAALVVVLAAALGAVGGEPKEAAVHVTSGPKVTSSGTSYGHGSGTVVAVEGGKSLILTNAHVVPQDRAGGCKVTHNGKEYPAKYLAGSTVREFVPPGGGLSLDIAGPDLALLVVDAELPAAELADKPPRLGARLRQWGFSGRAAKDGPSFKEGVVYDPARLKGTVDARPGDSGSGLFDEDGKLVAVTATRPNDENVKGVGAVPLGHVRGFLATKAADAFPRLAARFKGLPEPEYEPGVPDVPEPAPAPQPQPTPPQVPYSGPYHYPAPQFYPGPTPQQRAYVTPSYRRGLFRR